MKHTCGFCRASFGTQEELQSHIETAHPTRAAFNRAVEASRARGAKLAFDTQRLADVDKRIVKGREAEIEASLQRQIHGDNRMECGFCNKGMIVFDGKGGFRCTNCTVSGKTSDIVP